jgi:hypothetical protein
MRISTSACVGWHSCGLPIGAGTSAAHRDASTSCRHSVVAYVCAQRCFYSCAACTHTRVSWDVERAYPESLAPFLFSMACLTPMSLEHVLSRLVLVLQPPVTLNRASLHRYGAGKEQCLIRLHVAAWLKPERLALPSLVCSRFMASCTCLC